MLLHRSTVDQPVVQEPDGDGAGDAPQDLLHEATVGGRPVGYSKAQHSLLEGPEGSGESSLLPVPFVHLHAMERPLHVDCAEDVAAGQAGEAVLDGGHGEAVFLRDVVQSPPVDAPSDAPVLLASRDQVGAPRRVCRLDDAVVQPRVELLSEVRLKRRVDGPIPALDGRHVLRDDPMLEQVRLAVGTVVGEGIPELQEDVLGGLEVHGVPKERAAGEAVLGLQPGPSLGGATLRRLPGQRYLGRLRRLGRRLGLLGHAFGLGL